MDARLNAAARVSGPASTVSSVSLSSSASNGSFIPCSSASALPRSNRSARLLSSLLLILLLTVSACYCRDACHLGIETPYFPIISPSYRSDSCFGVGYRQFTSRSRCRDTGFPIRGGHRSPGGRAECACQHSCACRALPSHEEPYTCASGGL